jgi:hypothetical protein
VTSTVATLTVIVPPTIANQPVSQTNTQYSTATFSVAAAGTAPLNYQWSNSGGPLSDGPTGSGSVIIGSATATLTLTNISPADSDSYSVVVTNSGAAVTSSVATLTVLLAPPTITTQPVNQANNPGGTVVFNVAAFSSQPINYQWSKGGNNLSNAGNISGSGTAALTVSNIGVSDEGSYSVALTNNIGSAVSTSVALTVLVPIQSPQLSGANMFSFAFATSNGQSYTIEQNSDGTFTNWFYYTNIIGDGSPYQFILPIDATIPHQFFQVTEP